MARIWSSGFELQSVASGMEWHPDGTGPAGTPTIDTTTVRSGLASLRLTSPSSGVVKGLSHRVSVFTNGVAYFGRVYLYIASLPNVETAFAGFGGAAEANLLALTLDTAGRVHYHTGSGGSRQTLTGTTVLGTAQWHRIEWKLKRHATTPNAGADELAYQINGASEGSTTAFSVSTVPTRFLVGLNLHGNFNTATSADLYVDDCAFNDDTGSAQTSYPGAGSIVHLNVNGAGEFAQTVTLTTGEANAWQAIDEAPTPDDATSYFTLTDNATNWTGVGSRAAFAVESMPASPASVTLMEIGVRFSNDSASASNYALSVQTSNGGTKATDVTNTAFNTGVGVWATHKTGGLRVPPFVAYADPDAAAWTETSINALQLLIRATDANPDIFISKMWALVEYVPGAGGGSSILRQMMAHHA
jgi:hypothetical protein